MRHFAQELKQNGHQVVYTQLDDPNNAGSFKGELKRQIKEHNIDKIVVTQPGEHRVLEDMQSWQDDLGVAVDILDDDRFLSCPHILSPENKLVLRG